MEGHDGLEHYARVGHAPASITYRGNRRARRMWSTRGSAVTCAILFCFAAAAGVHKAAAALALAPAVGGAFPLFIRHYSGSNVVNPACSHLYSRFAPADDHRLDTDSNRQGDLRRARLRARHWT